MRYGAFGLVEVVGSSNAVIVIDQMLKTADVSFLTWNGKCGGHETVFMTGDVSAVAAAVQAVKENPSQKTSPVFQLNIFCYKLLHQETVLIKSAQSF